MLKVQFKPRLFPSEFVLLSATLSFSLTVDISTFCCTTKRSSPSIPLFSNSGSLLSCATKRTRSRKNRWNHFRLPSQHFRPISSCPPSFPPSRLGLFLFADRTTLDCDLPARYRRARARRQRTSVYLTHGHGPSSHPLCISRCTSQSIARPK